MSKTRKMWIILRDEQIVMGGRTRRDAIARYLGAQALATDGCHYDDADVERMWWHCMDGDETPEPAAASALQPSWRCRR